MTEVRLQIQGQRGAITADTLISALQHTLGVLREVDRTSRRGEGRPGKWRVGEVWNGSIGLALVLSREHGLRGADAIHLSSAIRGKAERFMTWDTKDFPIGRVIDGVAVQEPETYGQGTVPVT